MSSERLDPVKSLARQNTVIGVSITMTALSVVIVGLRAYTRTFIVRSIGKDDCAMLAALIFTLAYLATLLVLRENGMGFSGAVLSVAEMTTTIKTIVAIEILYYLCVNAVKISIVLSYLRIAVDSTFARLCKGTIAFLGIFCLVCIVVVLAQCRPLHVMWDFTGTVKGTCIDSTAFFYMTSSTNIVLDIWIIALPIKLLSSIRRPRREKLALICIFGLGVFSCIASIVRLYSVRIYTTSTDPFYDSVPINTWSMVEVNFAIYCACIPSLKALFNKAQRQRSQTAGYQYHSRDRTGTNGNKAFGTSEARDGNMGTIIRNEEFVMETTHTSEEDDRARALAAGAWSAPGSQERIVGFEHRV